MVFVACISIGEFATGAYNDPKTRALLMDMRLGGASDATCLHTLASLAEEGWMREAIWAEFNELPRTTLSQVLDTWAMAAKAGKTWEVSSEQPERTMEFARTKKVRLVAERTTTASASYSVTSPPATLSGTASRRLPRRNRLRHRAPTSDPSWLKRSLRDRVMSLREAVEGARQTAMSVGA